MPAVAQMIAVGRLKVSRWSIEVGNSDSDTATVAGRLVQVAMPLQDVEEGRPATLSISGYAWVQEGASAWLCVRTGSETVTSAQPELQAAAT